MGLNGMCAGAITSRVRACVVDSFLSRSQAETFLDSDDLLALLDSLQLLRLVIALESLFGIKIDNSDLSAEVLGSVEKVAAFVVRKQRGAAPFPADGVAGPAT